MRRAVVFGIAAALLPIGGAAAAGDPQQQAGPEKPQFSGKQHTVTLITGDRVVVTEGRPGMQVFPGDGRDHVRMLSYGGAGHRFVIPDDAARLVNSGNLDRRLFDVDTLIDMGYDDAHRGNIPLLTSGSGSRSVLDDVVGTTVTTALPAIGGAAIHTAKNTVGSLWRTLTGGNAPRAFAAGTDRVWLDGKRHATLDKSVPQIGAPTAWKAGYTGKGTTIAVLDTGVDDSHPDLAGREKSEKNFSDATDGGDHFGHGTHVASIAAGTGAKSNGKYKGVAFDAKYLDGKVLDDSGSGQESWIIARLQWAADQHADIANLSLGGTDAPGLDPLEKAVDKLSADTDTLYVIAAGNDGPSAETIGSPGSADAALTVGAVDDHDKLAEFSSRGPRIGDGGLKPDITAPGVGIVAARHSDGTIGPPVAPGYTELSGTSMATPHVVGAAALLAQQHPKMTGEQLKGLLTASAKPGKGLTAFQQGSGRVDSANALHQSVYTDPSSAGFGVQQWPHNDDKPVTRKVTYHNTGKNPVTLTLRTQATGPGGIAAPKGMFTLSATRITVPANGTKSVTATANTRTAPKDGTYSGAIVATGKNTGVRTAIAVQREVESYDVTVRNTARDGKPDKDAYVSVVNVGTGDIYDPINTNGVSTLRLPKDRYLLQTTTFGGTKEKPTTDVLTQPVLNVDHDTTVRADARLGKPIDITAPSKTAKAILGDFTVRGKEGKNSFYLGLSIIEAGFDGVRSAQLGPKTTPKDVSTQLGTSSTDGDDRYYGLTYALFGSVPTGFHRAPKESDLAKVRETYAKGPNASEAYVGVSPSSTKEPELGGTTVLVQKPLPLERTEFLSTEGMDWTHSMQVDDGNSFTLTQDSPLLNYAPGKAYTESMNRAVFGTSIPRTYNPSIGAYRERNKLMIAAPLFGDGSGNAGMSKVDSSYTRIFRDGKKIAENKNPGGGEFTVPAGAGAYRIATGATRDADLSSGVASEWTFRSAHTDKRTKLPVSTLRFTPKLDDANSAPAGKEFTVPVEVRKQLGGEVFVPKSLTAEVSYDGGKTWRPATVEGNTALVLKHPASGSVSLRAKATDSGGNTVRQTVVNAYTLH